MKKLRSARSRGYTAVEVMSALTLLSIGAAGVIGMQRVTIQGGEDARRFDMATNIANEWCTRLQRDSTLWTQPSDINPTVLNITNTQWLGSVNGSCNANFCNPPLSTPIAGGSGSFDVFGRDLDPGAGGAQYCAQYRLQWLQSPNLSFPFNPSAQVRAEVRVFWARLERNQIGSCASVNLDAAGADKIYHSVYATTTVRANTERN